MECLKMIKNDVLVQLPGYTFWFSNFKNLNQDNDHCVTLWLNDGEYTKYTADDAKDFFDKINHIIVEACAEYEKRNREYLIAMANDGVLPYNHENTMPITKLPKSPGLAEESSDKLFESLKKNGWNELKQAPADNIPKAPGFCR